MSNSNSPQLPDDFGLTMPNARPKKPTSAPPQSSDNFDLTAPNLNAPRSNNSSSDNFDETAPNLPTSPKPQNNRNQRDSDNDDFGFTMPNARQTPSEIDFGSTMTDFSSAQRQPRNEADADFGATMPYIKLPQSEQQRMRQAAQVAQAALNENPQRANGTKRGFPLWAWLIGGAFAGFAFLGIAFLAVLLLWRDSGFTLTVRGAQPNSEVYIDGTRRGVTSADGSTIIYGIEADKKRALKVTREGFTDFNDSVIGANGEKKQITAQMKPLETIVVTDNKPPIEPTTNEDSRVTEAEKNAFDALDKLKNPFTVDELVAAMNIQIINFESSKYDIPPARIKFLQRAAEKFKQLPAKNKVEIGGHTDTDGNPQNNLTLSNNRSIAVRATLVSFGVNPDMLMTKGFGSSVPVADNKSDDGKFKNRRIQYSVIAR
ncbi:MAG: OmpA family protein [Pyrinomonadaceae bacterium]|nr:OmpA family protein [Pyrinomonadaceae bacterium]